MLDYTGDAVTIGKNVGDDLLEGKITLPLIYVLKHGTEAEKNAIIHGINQPAKADIVKICDIIKNTGAINYCTALATQQSQIATQALAIFPESDYKAALIKLTQIGISRTY
jgi:octaprenyl-diphosphate synthase